jgi:glycosyltransferase involved in cell wall biosynthesis
MAMQRKRVLVIPNGFDLEVFRADASAREAFRLEIGAPGTAPLVGIVARVHPDKGYDTFLAAAERVAQTTDARFVLCGEGATSANQALCSEIQRRGLTDACHLIGSRSDMPRIYASLDVAVSASNTEAFPLAVGEAMACEVPCVATDVGDSRMLVGKHGKQSFPQPSLTHSRPPSRTC